jgi:hypothetical protein
MNSIGSFHNNILPCFAIDFFFRLASVHNICFRVGSLRRAVIIATKDQINEQREAKERNDDIPEDASIKRREFCSEKLVLNIDVVWRVGAPTPGEFCRIHSKGLFLKSTPRPCGFCLGGYQPKIIHCSVRLPFPPFGWSPLVSSYFRTFTTVRHCSEAGRYLDTEANCSVDSLPYCDALHFLVS